MVNGTFVNDGAVCHDTWMPNCLITLY